VPFSFKLEDEGEKRGGEEESCFLLIRAGEEGGAGPQHTEKEKEKRENKKMASYRGKENG